VSHTTRPPRGQEKHGREYFFLSNDEFDDMVSADAFLEWAEVHGNLYGTSKAALQSRIAAGEDVVLEIDYQGAMQVKALFPQAVLIFILPPSWDELRQRLVRRGDTEAAVIEARMDNARHEVAQAKHFDYVVINAVFETALFDLKTIVHAARLKYVAQVRHRSAVFQALNLL